MGDVRLVHIGVDIGQKHDPTAIVVCEVLERLGREIVMPNLQPFEAHVLTRRRTADIAPRVRETYYEARHIKRLPLMTGYPEVAEYIASMVTSPALTGYTIRLLIDCTGVGQPVFDMVRETLQHTTLAHIRPQAIMFTHGDKYDRMRGILGKAYLVSRLQALLQTHRVKLPPRHVEAQAMARELKDYDIKIEQNGNDTYGAFKVGSHDDLVTALGLASLDDPQTYRTSQGPRLFPAAQ